MADVLTLIELAVDARRYGPYVLYVDVRWDCVLAQQYNEHCTVLQRLRRISSLQSVHVRNFPPYEVRLVDALPWWARST